MVRASGALCAGGLAVARYGAADGAVGRVVSRAEGSGQRTPAPSPPPRRVALSQLSARRVVPCRAATGAQGQGCVCVPASGRARAQLGHLRGAVAAHGGGAAAHRLVHLPLGLRRLRLGVPAGHRVAPRPPRASSSSLGRGGRSRCGDVARRFVAVALAPLEAMRP
eukprot:scaffold4781_cov339-Prasinococcus_capsulatus_cf.AAC.18